MRSNTARKAVRSWAAFGVPRVSRQQDDNMPNHITQERTRRRQQMRELLGFDLNSERIARRLTQEGLASLIGVTRRTCSAWEAGEYAPELPHLLALRRVFVGDADVLEVVAV